MSEFNVFLAAMRWVDADKTRDHYLDEVLGLVRFPTMDYEELGLVGKHPTAAGTPILKVGFVAQPPPLSHNFHHNHLHSQRNCINAVACPSCLFPSCMLLAFLLLYV